jgi:hypothetical protein
MYERPALFRREGCYEIYIAADRAVALLRQLTLVGFDATRLDGEFGTEDPDTGSQTELAVLRLPPDTDKLALRKYLRERSA